MKTKQAIQLIGKEIKVVFPRTGIKDTFTIVRGIRRGVIETDKGQIFMLREFELDIVGEKGEIENMRKKLNALSDADLRRIARDYSRQHLPRKELVDSLMDLFKAYQMDWENISLFYGFPK